VAAHHFRQAVHRSLNRAIRAASTIGDVRRRCVLRWLLPSFEPDVFSRENSEEIVGQALADMPVSERPFVFTKCGLIWDETDRMVMPKKIGTPASIRDEVVASLRRLRTERIDPYQMHWPTQDGTWLEEYWQTLLDLKAEGKVRAVGLSNHDTAQLETAERLGHVDTLQPQFSTIHRDVATAELPWCRAHNTGVIVYSPMASGLLTGAFTGRTG
jgi:aryl-alcohol dehydrogenase-like predicted oxidoreductase